MGSPVRKSVLLAQGSSASSIAERLGVHRSTIYREPKRNRSQKTKIRLNEAIKYRIPEQFVLYVELALSWLRSPEPTSEVGKLLGSTASHERIYRHIAHDK